MALVVLGAEIPPDGMRRYQEELEREPCFEAMGACGNEGGDSREETTQISCTAPSGDNSCHY